MHKHRDQNVYVHKTALGMATEILEDYPSGNFYTQVSGAYPVALTRVQHWNSDLEYVLRLLAEAGLNYRFEHLQADGKASNQAKTRHALVIFDQAVPLECSVLPDYALSS
jgi:type VI secretion system secreted protein VgrG